MSNLDLLRMTLSLIFSYSFSPSLQKKLYHLHITPNSTSLSLGSCTYWPTLVPYQIALPNFYNSEPSGVTQRIFPGGDLCGLISYEIVLPAGYRSVLSKCHVLKKTRFCGSNTCSLRA